MTLQCKHWWLRIYGREPGIQTKDGRYEFPTTTTWGCKHLLVDLAFIDEARDISIEVVDPTGAVWAGAYSATDNEHLVPHAFGAGAGNTYDLWSDNVG